MPLLFVYGSLKEGFPNFHVNKGRRLPGAFVTVLPHPLVLAEGVLPCLLPQPGAGLRVRGQLFEVDEAQLAAMDELERVGQPGGYARVPIEVEPFDGSASRTSDVTPGRVTAFAYMQSEARLHAGRHHVGPIAEYTMEHAQSLRW